MISWIVFFAVFAYLLGSISSAVLICKLFKKADPRTQGSLNPGATNVLRIAGRLPASLVLIVDVLKGAIPTYLAFWYGLPEWSLGLVAICACLGHMYPIFFGFKGGKAVATALGAMMPIGWPIAISLLLTWIVVAKITHYSSMAALVTVIVAPIITYLYKPNFTIAVAMLSVLIIVKHRANIYRLLSGNENSFKSDDDHID